MDGRMLAVPISLKRIIKAEMQFEMVTFTALYRLGM